MGWRARVVSIVEQAAMRLAVVCAAAVLGLAGCDAREQACNDANAAYMAAQALVAERLVSPVTASFPIAGEKGAHVDKSDGCRYLISSYVDSQNLFGAMVRSKFDAIMVLSPNGSWEPDGFNISEFQGNGAVKRD